MVPPVKLFDAGTVRRMRRRYAQQREPGAPPEPPPSSTRSDQRSQHPNLLCASFPNVKRRSLYAALGVGVFLTACGVSVSAVLLPARNITTLPSAAAVTSPIREEAISVPPDESVLSAFRPTSTGNTMRSMRGASNATRLTRSERARPAATSVAAGDRFETRQPEDLPRLWQVTLSVSGE